MVGAAVGMDSASVLENYDRCHSFCDAQNQLYGGGELSYESDISVRGGSATSQYFVSGLAKYDNGAQIGTGYGKQSIRVEPSSAACSRSRHAWRRSTNCLWPSASIS